MRRILLASVMALSLAATASFSTHSAGARSTKSVSGATKSVGPLLDKGGQVLVAPTTYAIFWGPTSSFPSDLRSGIETELSGFAGSGYLNIATQYLRGASITTHFGGSLLDQSAPPKSAPNVQALANEVVKVVGSANLDPGAVYLVYTSNDPTKSYCAWHDQASVGSVNIQVGYLPNTATLTGCMAPLVGSTPWSDATRGIADSTAHELMEAITDAKPGTAWVDRNGLEIGDKCEYNTEGLVTLGSSVFQLQPEWSNAANNCVFSA